MRKKIHPKLITTTIQLKDGSVYDKGWLFFKSSLFLETDLTSNVFWKKQNLNKSTSLKKQIDKKNANNSSINS